MDDKKKLPPLSERMAAVAAMVNEGNTCADIGCDHAYVPIYLYNSGKCPKCIACDVKQGPLESAAANVEKYGAADGVEVRLSDGLEAVKEGEADTIIIAGMGGESICGILRAGDAVVQSAKELILEPQSEPEKVRRLISEAGFFIADEDMIIESRKFYPIIKAIKAAEPVTYTEVELNYGPYLIKKMPKAFVSYLKKKRLDLIILLRRIGVFDRTYMKDMIEKADAELRVILKLLTSQKK